jgi:N-acetylmuramoyl-L-alanine amidase/putative methionine-R-sulfoxide reductase with GAF domain
LPAQEKTDNFEDESFLMATTPTDPRVEAATSFLGVSAPAWTRVESVVANVAPETFQPESSSRNALQALLAFSALHEQVRRRTILAARHNTFDAPISTAEFESGEQFVLDEVLHLVAERAIAITGADGLAIALADNNEIVLRASAGTIRPDIGARIDRDSAFSGACFRTAQVITCDDTETDARVNLNACRKLGTRSMVAVPLCGRRRVIGLLEAFSATPFAFNDNDAQNLTLLAELILGALKPKDEDRFAESAKVAVNKLGNAATTTTPIITNVTNKSDGIVVTTTKVVDSINVTDSLVSEAAAEPPNESTTETAKHTEIAEATIRAIDVAESATVREFVPEQVERPSRRPIVFALLAMVLVICAVAAGIWWKTQTVQLGNAIVHSKFSDIPAATATDGTTAKDSTATSPASSADATTSANTNDSLESIPRATEAENTASSEIARVPRVTGIRHWTSVDSSTVVLDLEDQVQYEAHRLPNPDRIYFDLRDTKLAPELEGKTVEVGDTLLNRIRVAQPEAGITRVVLETKANSTYSVSLEPNPYRLVVKVSKIGTTPQNAVNLFPGTDNNKLAIVIPPPTKDDLQLRSRVPKMRIVVDAGHGGWDLGTVGRRGLLEKDLVLEIAQRLGKLLESRLGSEVVYTRNDDNYIPLDERAGIANQAQADLFVSVHANYSDLPSARGVETYYTNFFSAPNAKDLETRANTGGSKPAVTATLSPADLHERIEQSRRLAASVQRSLYGTLSVQNPGLRDRGIKEAGFVVLTETSMPGILAEVSFVSSPTDEQRLRSDGYREEIAEALYKGIARYAVNSRATKIASAAKQ